MEAIALLFKIERMSKIFFILDRYEVHGIIRRSSTRNTGRIEHLYSDTRTHSEGSMKLHYGDLVDGKALPLHFKHVSLK